jgi:hypothetical protein
MGVDVFNGKVQAVVDGWQGPQRPRVQPGMTEEDVESNRKADERALMERAEEIVAGIGDPLGYPDLRGYGQRVVDDILKLAWAGIMRGGLGDVDMDVLEDV